jgi:hypothetical protein
MTIREYFALEIYKSLVIYHGVHNDPEDTTKETVAVARADTLLRYLQDNPTR